MSPEEIEAHAQAAIDKGSASFAAAARMFDRQTRLSVVLLYACLLYTSPSPRD